VGVPGLKDLGRCWPAIRDLFTAVPAGPEPQPTLPPVADNGTFGARLTGEIGRRPGRLMVACLATVLGPAVAVQAGALNARSATDTPPAEKPAGPAPAPRPGDAATWRPVAAEAAATCPGLPPDVLVAIAQVESSLGLQTWTSSAGAVGPMQFLPATWRAYGADGDRDGSVDVMNSVDAVHGAARLLCANGGGDPARLASALWNYNHSHDYVHRVLTLAHAATS
jgi:hypothetical protein